MFKKAVLLSAILFSQSAFSMPIYNMIIGTGSGAYVSSNNGQTWNQANLPGSPYIRVDAALAVKNIMLAAVDNVGVYISNNAGQSWTLINTLPEWGNFRFIDLNGASIFVETDRGLYRSDDMGVTWKEILPYAVLEIAFQGQSIFAAGQNSSSGFDIDFSSNNGDSFTEITPPSHLANPAVLAIVGNTLFLGCGGVGLYASHDYGQTWQNNPQIPQGALYNSMMINPLSPNELFFNTPGGYGQFISTDAGVTWQSIPDLSKTQNIDFVFSGHNVIAASSLLGGLISKNLGLPGTWMSLQPQIENTDMMRIATAQDNYVLMSGTDRTFQTGLTYLSGDGGLTWSSVKLKTPDPLYVVSSMSISQSGS